MRRVRPQLTGAVMALAGLAASAAMQPAQAQFWGHPPPIFDQDDELSPGELGRAAIAQGFEITSRPKYGVEYATATARDRAGRSVRLTMDSFSGQVVSVRALAAAPQERPNARVTRVPERVQERPKPQQEAAVPREPAAPRAAQPANPANRATPDRPTVIRREPLLPAPSAPSAQGPAAVGSGTRAAPRQIEIAPSTGDSVSGSTPPL